jgi:hypothetical protein
MEETHHWNSSSNMRELEETENDSADEIIEM